LVQERNAFFAEAASDAGFHSISCSEGNLGSHARDCFWTVKIEHFPHRTSLSTIAPISQAAFCGPACRDAFRFG
jgi:hypothetical protein